MIKQDVKCGQTKREQQHRQQHDAPPVNQQLTRYDIWFIYEL